MSAVFRYWRWIRINAQGMRSIEEIAEAKAFMHQQFPTLQGIHSDAIKVDDVEIQQQLVEQMQTGSTGNAQEAECCLRCFISHQIDWVCQDLTSKFGRQGQFKSIDLLQLVLTDVAVLKSNLDPSNSSSYQSLASKILQTFDPNRSQLSTWVKRLVASDREINAFLVERGIYLESSWAVLNSKSPQYLQRRLSLSPAELKVACALLESYHAVYLRDRLQVQQTSRRCSPPTTEQLIEMAKILQVKLGTIYSPEEVLESLHRLADRIRANRRPKIESIDDGQYRSWVEEQPVAEPDDLEEQNEFLRTYRREFQAALMQAIEQTVFNYFCRYQKRNEAEAQKFLKGLCLFHCHAIAMTKLNTYLQKEQYQVSRLLQLLKLREDVKRNTQIKLRAQVQELAARYITLSQLEQLMEKIDVALEEEIDRVMKEAQAEASTGKRDKQKPRSLFSSLLCRYLDQCSYFDCRSLQP